MKPAMVKAENGVQPSDELITLLILFGMRIKKSSVLDLVYKIIDSRGRYVCLVMSDTPMTSLIDIVLAVSKENRN